MSTLRVWLGGRDASVFLRLNRCSYAEVAK
jgi:hypothetical protein